MFLPEVTNSRSPTTLAPVVRPTSCLSEPRYSTLPDITASGSGGTAAAAGAAAHSSVRTARHVTWSDLISSGSNEARGRNLRCASVGGDREHRYVVTRRAGLRVDRSRLDGRHDRLGIGAAQRREQR